MIHRTQSRLRLGIALLALNLLFIWGNSLLPASASGSLSQWIRDLLGLVLPGDPTPGQSDGLLRKLAHFAEFCCLGLCLSWVSGMCAKNLWKSVTLSAACGFIAACVDELLQHLSPGRAPRFTDVLIDTAGVVVGIILLWVGHTICQKKNIINFGGKQT